MAQQFSFPPSPTDLERLLKDFDITEFKNYLILEHVLPDCDCNTLNQLTKRRDIIKFLKQKVSNYRENIHQAVCDFAQRAADRVKTILGLVSESPKRRLGKTVHANPRLASVGPQPEKTKNHLSVLCPRDSAVHDMHFDETESSSSSSADDLESRQFSQEVPDGTFDGKEDPGYYTQSNSLASNPTDPGSLNELSPITRLSLYSQKDRLPQSKRQSRIVHKHYFVTHNYGPHHYYHNTPADQAFASMVPVRSDQRQALKRSHLSEEIAKLRKILGTCTKELTTCMNIQSLLPCLKQEQLVTDAEVQKLTNSTKTDHEKNEILLTILPSKGENTFERFIKCLENANDHSGHAHLAKLLQGIN